MQGTRERFGASLRALGILTGDDQQVAARVVAHARHGIGNGEVHQRRDRQQLRRAVHRVGSPAPAFEHKRVIPEVVSGGNARAERGRRHLVADGHSM